MLSNIEETLPTTMHLPGSSEDTLHFYRYQHTHVLIANRQFLLFIDAPLQDHTQQLSIYKIFFTLDIPHGNFTAWYDISTQYLGVTQDETREVEISQHQFCICQEANGQFGNVYATLQLLAIPPSCITASYARNTATTSTRCPLQIRKTQSISIPSQITPNVRILTSAPFTVTTTITLICPGEHAQFITVKKPIHILQLPPACSATSPHFYLPPWSEDSKLAVNISLDMANLNIVNISSLDFCICQHLKDHRNETQLHHCPAYHQFQLLSSTSTWSVATHISPLSHHLLSQQLIHSIWTLFSHTGAYVTAIGLLILVGLGIFCCYFFWCQPVRLAHQPLQPGSMW